MKKEPWVLHLSTKKIVVIVSITVSPLEGLCIYDLLCGYSIEEPESRIEAKAKSKMNCLATDQLAFI